VLKTFEDYYVKKDFANALLTLQTHQKDLPRDLWHYNVGTVQAKMENWASARYHLLMAEELGLTASELNLNKKLVEDKLEVSRLERPLNFSDYVYQTASAASEGYFTALALVILVAGLLLLRRAANLSKLLILTILVLVPLGLNWWINAWPRAITGSTQVVREGPSQIFAERTELPAGTLIIYHGEGEWKEVRWPSRFAGWINRSDLLELE